MKKAIAASAAGLALTISACGETEPTPTAPNSAPREAFFSFGSDLNRWDIQCNGPYKSVTVEPGDTLLRLVLNNTVLADQLALGRPDMPREFVVEAVASINELPDVDTISAGQELFLPDNCHPVTAR